jgi:arsenate reductase (glutaredoxin)
MSPATKPVADRITIYQKPTCTTCRSVVKVLKEAGVEFDSVDYYVEPLSERKIIELLAKMGMTAKQALRTSETVYQRLKISVDKLSENEIVSLMVKHPDLLQRPIVEKDGRAILARPAEKIREFLK